MKYKKGEFTMATTTIRLDDKLKKLASDNPLTSFLYYQR